MLPQRPPAPQARRIGVGIDTARYGHYACFLHDDLQPAAPELAFAESGAGYAQLRQRLRDLAQRHGPVHFVIRLDAAGQYADNLRHYLQTLTQPALTQPAHAGRSERFAITLSCGDPQRNKNYRAALFGSQKSDPVEARAAARFALTERPTCDTPLSLPLRTLRQVAGRLQAVVRQRTRLVNQFHHLLALTFPELALVTKDLAAGWVLELVHRYPTAPSLAAATPADLEAIPYLPHQHLDTLLSHARASVASLTNDTTAELVRDHVRQLRDNAARQKRLENLLVGSYRALPTPNHLDTIPGLGDVTAAILTAFIADIERFDSPAKLVAYFGVLPIEASSGVERDGTPRGPRRYVMSRRGNDLVRRYLWMAALSAIRFNPAVRALYARVVAKHPASKAVAVGHAMRKLLHLAFAVWKAGKPFDPQHYPWATPAHVEQASDVRNQESAAPAAGTHSDTPMSEKDQAAGLKQTAEPARREVTTAQSSSSTRVDFAHLKSQLTLARVLDQLGLLARLKGGGPQRRGPCPLHRGDGRGRTFSVNLDDHVFQCFDASCQKKGDVLDLWASVMGMSLREAALDLARTFDLEPTPPRKATEKRNG
jgi:transposase